MQQTVSTPPVESVKEPQHPLTIISLQQELAVSYLLVFNMCKDIMHIAALLYYILSLIGTKCLIYSVKFCLSLS